MADLHPEEDERTLKKRLKRKLEHTDTSRREASRVKGELHELHVQHLRAEEDAKNRLVQAAARVKRAADEDRAKLQAKRAAANDKEVELVALRARLAELQVLVSRVDWPAPGQNIHPLCAFPCARTRHGAGRSKFPSAQPARPAFGSRRNARPSAWASLRTSAEKDRERLLPGQHDGTVAHALLNFESNRPKKTSSSYYF
jgi:hypothetical protein